MWEDRLGPTVAAAVVTLGLVVLLPDPDREPLTGGPPAEEAFLDAYERSRMVEVVVRSTFTRTFPDGRDLSYEQRLVQRPPGDRLVVGAGSASGRIDGRIVRCNASPSGEPECVQGAAAAPYADEVAAEVSALADLVDRDVGGYEVSLGAGAGCFELTLVRRILTPPYGVAATFCFDADSGALTVLDVERPEARDRTEATEIRTEVTAADLRAADLGETVNTG